MFTQEVSGFTDVNLNFIWIILLNASWLMMNTNYFLPILKFDH
jgi:hypothetical protein